MMRWVELRPERFPVFPGRDSDRRSRFSESFPNRLVPGLAFLKRDWAFGVRPSECVLEKRFNDSSHYDHREEKKDRG